MSIVSQVRDTAGTVVFAEPMFYTLRPADSAMFRDARGHGQWVCDIPSAPAGHRLEGMTTLPESIDTGAKAHKFVQDAFPGIRYAPQDQKRARKYRGAYPGKIADIFFAGALAVVTCNSGARYSIPVGRGRVTPSCGEYAAAFERTDWTGATYQADCDTTGETLSPCQFAAVDAVNRAARVDLPPVTDMPGYDLAAVPALLPVDPRNDPLRLKGSARAPVRCDNVEYYAGKAARANGVGLFDCPHLPGGERAERWSRGWQEGTAPADSVSRDQYDALKRAANDLLRRMETPRTRNATEAWTALRNAVAR